MRFDQQFGRLAARRQSAQRPGGSADEVADAVDVEDEAFLIQAVDDAAQLADHAAPLARARRCWAWQMATASASAASGAEALEAGNSILTIIATWFFSACPTPTTVFLIRLAAYSETGRFFSASAARATPRACPSFKVD